jgi:CBS domain-containing protein
MGLHDISPSDEVHSQAFQQALLRDLAALEYMLDHGLIEDAQPRIGAEQEMFLVDDMLRPAPVALEVLERLDNPQFTTEMGKFNLELNLEPLDFRGSSLRSMENTLLRSLDQARLAARQCGANVLLAGTLPTAHQYHLSLDNLTPSPRYRQLNDAMQRLRGPTYTVHIKGIDELNITHDNVMLEACCTSFQVHFQVSPAKFASAYNVAQMITAPVLAAAVNSPLLLGQRLWEETRVAVFQHSVDERSPTLLMRGHPARVSFGERWVEESVIEIFREEIARFRVIMAAEIEENALAVVGGGGIPNLKALRVHNGTVWRWNRPCYGLIDGRAHLRIEARAFPAGPSVYDEVANAAFFFGLLTGMSGEHANLASHFRFEDAKNNFFLAARSGLQAQFIWLDGQRVPATTLILTELLPVARAGLRHTGISSEDIDRYLGAIEERVRRDRTGAQWALQSLAAMPNEGSREARHRALTAAMLANQRDNLPVHEWQFATLWPDETPADFAYSVEDFMSTDLLTVQPGDLVGLAANLMQWRGINHLPVEDDAGRLIGLVSYRELLPLLAAETIGRDYGKLCVRDVMRSNPVTVAPETPLATAIEAMHNGKTDCLPVVVGERLVGLLTIHDLLRLFSRMYARRRQPSAAAAHA